MNRKVYKLAIVLLLIVTIPSATTLILTHINSEQNKTNKDVKGENQICIMTQENGVETIFSLNTYIMMAMAADIPSYYEIEALKAQATMIRTYVYVVAQKKHTYDLDASDIGLQYLTYSQIKDTLGNLEVDMLKKLKRAVEETENEVIVYEDTLIIPLFHPVSVGMTRNAKNAIDEDIPYLISVESKGDVQSNDYMNITSMSKEKVVQLINREYPESKITEDTILECITVNTMDEDGYIKYMNIGDIRCTGEEFASVFQLNSTHFYMETFEDSIRFICKGKGHGLGLSQFGANLKALQGYGYEEILQYYFANTKVLHYDLDQLLR